MRVRILLGNGLPKWGIRSWDFGSSRDTKHEIPFKTSFQIQILLTLDWFSFFLAWSLDSFLTWGTRVNCLNTWVRVIYFRAKTLNSRTMNRILVYGILDRSPVYQFSLSPKAIAMCKKSNTERVKVTNNYLD